MNRRQCGTLRPIATPSGSPSVLNAQGGGENAGGGRRRRRAAGVVPGSPCRRCDRGRWYRQSDVDRGRRRRGDIHRAAENDHALVIVSTRLRRPTGPRERHVRIVLVLVCRQSTGVVGRRHRSSTRGCAPVRQSRSGAERDAQEQNGNRASYPRHLPSIAFRDHHHNLRWALSKTSCLIS